MTTTTYYRVAVAAVCIAAVLAVPALVIGSTFTRAALVISVLAAGSLIYRHGRKGGPE
jgi:anti-sigma-K factor RskA